MVFKENDYVLLILKSDKEKRFFIRLQKDKELHTHKGFIKHNDIIGKENALPIISSLGKEFVVLSPRVDDLIMKSERKTQIVYPKDIGVILLRGDVRKERTIIEAGTGSGVLTGIMAMVVGESGKIKSFEWRNEFYETSIKNIKRFGDFISKGIVEIIIRDVYKEGFSPHKGDSLILDLPEPWECFKYLKDVLEKGGSFVSLLPTVTQVATLLEYMKDKFIDITVEEILSRKWKTEVKTLRPYDRMVAHTAFIISGRFVGY
ncbi:MAG: tRNA (adenine-N1)-methyltransferase [Candidatus Hydrogenedentota bacterium]